MKRLKITIAAFTLTVVLSAASAFAGDMPTGGIVPPGPRQTTSSTGDMPTGGLVADTDSTEGYVDPLAEFGIWLLSFAGF